MYIVKFFDTHKNQIVDFRPQRPQIQIYVCGITPYDSAHLGHIFTFMTYDLLQRRLEDLGHKVKLVRNITDVDEPIFLKAKQNNEHYVDLATREINSFKEIMKRLNFRDPDAEPLASDFIAEMADAVKWLIDHNYAYKLDNDIYFDVMSDPKFGSFCHLPDKLQLTFMSERGGDPKRPGKRQPLDFLLWRGITDPNDPAAWNSPVGYGRPGWHIECSVMSAALLNTPLDIHGGGMDLIFPHHECEIAQSEALNDHSQFADNWLHVAPLLRYGEKMSKSLGNLVFAKDLLNEPADPAAIRLALMHYHYRSGGEWRDEVWEDTKSLVNQAADLLRRGEGSSSDNQEYSGLRDKVRACLDDNLDTPSIVSLIKEHITGQKNSGELKQTLELLGLSINV